VFVPERAESGYGGPKIVGLSPDRLLPESSRAVRDLLDWSVTSKTESVPASAQKLGAHLEKEISDSDLSRLALVKPAVVPERQARRWQRVLDRGYQVDANNARRLDVVLDLLYAVDVFEATATLDDVLPREGIEALYRLGQYMVQLNYPRWSEMLGSS